MALRKTLIGIPQSRRRHRGDAFEQWRYIGEEKSFRLIRGEMAMWKAVVTQAVMDALSNNKQAEEQYAKHQAINYLSKPSEDLAFVCELANFEMGYVLRKAKVAIANQVSWRAEAGKGARYEQRKKYRDKQKALQP